MLTFLRLVILPFRYARLTAYYISATLCHPVTVIVIAFFVWRSFYTPNGHDASGFLFTMVGYIGLIAFPAHIIRNVTRPPPTPRTSALPKEDKWPASAEVALAIPEAPAAASLPEADMWKRLDPLLQRLAQPPGS